MRLFCETTLNQACDCLNFRSFPYNTFTPKWTGLHSWAHPLIASLFVNQRPLETAMTAGFTVTENFESLIKYAVFAHMDLPSFFRIDTDNL